MEHRPVPVARFQPVLRSAVDWWELGYRQPGQSCGATAEIAQVTQEQFCGEPHECMLILVVPVVRASERAYIADFRYRFDVAR